MRNKRPGRLEVTHVYAKRIIRWKRNSSPYLSGDAFSDISDISFGAPKFRSKKFDLNELYGAKVIFVRGGLLSNFLEEHAKKLSAVVIFAGNDDTEHHEIPSRLPKNLRHMYLQNSFISDNKKIFTLPIGLENFRYGVNGNPKLLRQNPFIRKERKILVGPLGNTHEIRQSVLENFSSTEGPWDVLQEYVPPKKFNELALGYLWVACVRGNGIDTHRTWETLYRQGIPLLIRDEWSRSLNYLRLPIQLVSEWDPSEMRNLVTQTAPEFQATQIPQLWMPWWIDRVRRIT